MKTEKQQGAAAAAFVKRWQGRGYEKGESQTFWIELLTEVFGVEEPSTFIRFEQQAMLDRVHEGGRDWEKAQNYAYISSYLCISKNL